MKADCDIPALDRGTTVRLRTMRAFARRRGTHQHRACPSRPKSGRLLDRGGELRETDKKISINGRAFLPLAWTSRSLQVSSCFFGFLCESCLGPSLST